MFRSPDAPKGRNPGSGVPPDDALRSPYGSPFRRSTRFALLSASLHPATCCQAIMEVMTVRAAVWSCVPSPSGRRTGRGKALGYTRRPAFSQKRGRNRPMRTGFDVCGIVRQCPASCSRSRARRRQRLSFLTVKLDRLFDDPAKLVEHLLLIGTVTCRYCPFTLRNQLSDIRRHGSPLHVVDRSD